MPQYTLFKYKPNRPLCIVAIACFAAMSVLLFVQIMIAKKQTYKLFQKLAYDGNYVMKKKQKWELWSVTFGIYIPLIVGGLLEVGGYIARIVCTNNVYAVGPFIGQTVLVLVAPGMISGTLYMLFHDFVRFLNCPSDSGVSFFIKDSLMVKLFVAGDVISFFLQAAGGGIMSQISTQKSGEKLIVVGLFVQLVSFGFFLFMQINFSIRYKKYSKDNYISNITKKWMILNYCMIGSSVCILLRSIVRTVEFIQGFNGAISSRELYLYVFDALPMLISLIFFSVAFLFVQQGQFYFWFCSFTSYGQSSDEREITDSEDDKEREVL